MSIDIARLARDAERLHKEQQRPARPGSYAIVRAALPKIREMREKGIAWDAIAAAMAAQGVTQGSGDKSQPITGNRLRALAFDVEKRNAIKRERAAKRAQRPDLARPPEQKGSGRRKFGLADELAVKRADASTAPETPTEREEAIRRRRLAEVQALTKKK